MRDKGGRTEGALAAVVQPARQAQRVSSKWLKMLKVSKALKILNFEQGPYRLRLHLSAAVACLPEFVPADLDALELGRFLLPGSERWDSSQDRFHTNEERIPLESALG